MLRRKLIIFTSVNNFSQRLRGGIKIYCYMLLKFLRLYYRFTEQKKKIFRKNKKNVY